MQKVTIATFKVILYALPVKISENSGKPFGSYGKLFP